MNITVRGRHTEVNDRFRRHVDNKLAKIERLNQKVIRVDVEVSEERNPRLADQRERVELTIRSRGPVIRAEAAADDRYGALDLALDKLESRLRRDSERRKGHGGKGRAKLATMEPLPEPLPPVPPEPVERPVEDEVVTVSQDENLIPIPMDGDGPLVVREKFHKAEPMGIEQALFEMELVGHDFFLYRDKATGHPSVVYRRRGWDYGVIRLVEE
ncbi:ribosome hibernation-promoting factor, HPF/YfiA family [Actinomadura madurae]|uniref:ribosome hibernation-promoting factor, HPF/YfiA family n=1 Tax=Actinomadura madurae TaxID=1993 RepID=UPI0020264D4F|nr:ribosome-associated translation inhibitor RaiA [Actinomadura madurae]MCP9950516.1 ribosome-associated translation inhibitor RaiA [Actinomadura madurae]MCP9967299.1 ribosome-associated translation inhibitor RaiA [Actinomadura madurae]MCP9979754.1 ribosome-associated translation inhibitor RaiA [Actinomadura madurae]MCQ0008714.1 ribosome-associated translation inhibitor RaiA [Actinomadura madurae]MCQ0015962.1 ribosome-associated translation inhibitor RaiA [Actinomadura madurae]